MSESIVYRYINLLKELKMLDIKPNNKFSVVTIEKWEDYQINRNDIEQQANNRYFYGNEQQNNKGKETLK